MTLYDQTAPQMSKMLGNLDSWLTEAEAWAETRGFDAEQLLSERLFPDQFPLSRQIQSACDAAKFAVARSTGREFPAHPDDETTLAQLRARIAAVRELLDGVTADDFAGAETRILAPAMLQGARVTVPNYVNGFAVPNFYFHVVTAYAILRSAGVALGKRTYIGAMDLLPSA